ncbi:MAG: helix-turn-helix transcriptional regulator [Pseudomonadota bacterium]
MQKVIFESDEMPGSQRERMERWIETLSSGYVRLSADPVLNSGFSGKLKIVQLHNTTIGTIDGTVRNISRTITDVAIENTDNVVLLLNRGPHTIEVEQKGKKAECVCGGATLIEQCEPSTINMNTSAACNLIAIQAPREQVRRRFPALTDRLLAPMPALPGLSLTRAYTEFLLNQPDFEDPSLTQLANDHIIDLFASTLCSDGDDLSHGSKAGRRAMILREMDRGFTEANFSLTVLARKLSVTPRYVQSLLTDVGTSFIEQLTQRRLKRASNLLTSPSHFRMSVLDISQECGFSTVSHFHRIFRRRFHVTPGEMRDSARKQKLS